MKIAIANDHRGVDLKKYLIENLDYDITDLGTNTNDSVDYPDYGFLIGEEIASGKYDFGIAICGSGIGISIACNKVKGIRCAKVSNIDEARITRIDNNANVIALCADLDKEEALEIVNMFLNTEFTNEERHMRRINKISTYEDKHYEC